MTWGIGKSAFHLSGAVGFRDGYIAAELVVDCANGPALYDLLRAQNDDIESETGFKLSWEYDSHRRSNYARVRRNDVDPMNRGEWPELHAWLREKLEALDRSFRDRVARLDASE